MQAILALEDGRIFRGKGFGAKGECYGEVVFNTSITGYQEIFTDPSYAGQIVILTNPQIGNYGTNSDDNEATRPYIEGLIVREFSRVSSNWRSQEVAEEYLERYKIPVLAEIDTRALVRHLRTHGVMRGVISTLEFDTDKLVAKARSIPKMDGTDLAKEVTTPRVYQWDEGVRSYEPTEVVGVKDGDAEVQRRGLRLRHQAEHHASPGGRIVQRHRGSGDHQRRRRAGDEARRRIPLQRPRRSRACDLRARQHSPHDGQGPHLRHLPRPSADRPRARRQDLQAEVRTPRRQPSGEGSWRPARSRSPRTTTTSPSIPIR